MSNENETRRIARQEIAAALRMMVPTEASDDRPVDMFDVRRTYVVLEAPTTAEVTDSGHKQFNCPPGGRPSLATEDTLALDIAQPGPHSVGATTSSAAFGEAGTPLPPQPTIPPPSEANVERMRKTASGVLLDLDVATSADNLDIVAEALARVYEGGKREREADVRVLDGLLTEAARAREQAKGHVAALKKRAERAEANIGVLDGLLTEAAKSREEDLKVMARLRAKLEAARAALGQ